MDIKFKEDKNGKIADKDKFFDKLDEMLDKEDYNAAAEAILSIPREKWSLKLRFRLINAYSNLRDFAKAEKELDEAAELCEKPNDVARVHYSRGYLCYMDDKDIMAREHYIRAAKTDPKYAKQIGLDEDINECGKMISEDLASYHALCETISAQIKARCNENSKKKNISDEGFQMRLGFFPAIRKLPGFERPMGFEDYFAEYKGEDRKNCLRWFENFYGVTDEDSFFRHIHNDTGCNIARMVFDVAAYLAGDPNFDIKQLNEGGRFSFETTAMFVTTFLEYLPKAGVLAWDISEKIGFARHAHRCGIISNSEYAKGMLALSDNAKSNFSGWEEYMRSLIFGAGLFMFGTDEWSIQGAAKFMSNMTPLLVQSDLADVIWYGGENPYDRENYKHRS